MGRLRPSCSANRAAKTVAYFRERAEQFYRSGHSAIAADYVIRGLMLRRRDSDLLQLGAALGRAVGQPELSDKCAEALQAAGKGATLAPFVGSSPERLTTPCADCEPINALLMEALGERPPIQCASFTGSGRGLIADRLLPKGSPVFAERPMFVQRRSAHFCAQCLAPLQLTSIPCGGQGCTETYCSESCKAEAAEEGHSVFCQNEAVNAITGALQRDVASERRGNASVALGALVVVSMILRSIVQRTHPLAQHGVVELSGAVSYDPASTLDQTGALVVQLGQAVGQPHLVLEDFLTLYGKVQMNEFVGVAGCGIYRCLSMLNHSCVPNAEVTPNEKGHAVLTPLVEIPRGQQLFIDYTASAMQNMPYARRVELLSQRHFECFCPKCVKRI